VIYNEPSLVKNNYGLDFHPFHAHGGHYYDIGSGNGTYNATENELHLQGYNPVLRDTTLLYRYTAEQTVNTNAGWRAWRLRVEDAGVWMVCPQPGPPYSFAQATCCCGNDTQLTGTTDPLSYLAAHDHGNANSVDYGRS
jgi:hypothetical protein